MGWRQPGHLTQRPSVRTFLVPASGPFSAAGPPASEEYSPSSRLNHDIPNPIVYGWRGRSGGGRLITSPHKLLRRNPLSKTLNRFPESAALFRGCSRRNRLQRRGGVRSLQRECDTTGPASAE